MKDILIAAMYAALQDEDNSEKDIINHQDEALLEIFEKRIAPYTNDEALYSDLMEILITASKAAFAKGIEAVTAVNS